MRTQQQAQLAADLARIRHVHAVAVGHRFDAQAGEHRPAGVALRTRRPLVAVEVRAARTMVVEAGALAGWTGSLVPRLTGGTVEFSGDGIVYLEERA